MRETEINKNEETKIVIFKTDDEKILVDVSFGDDNAWLTQQQIAELFETARTSIVEHIKHIYDEGELSAEATCRDFRQVRKEGNRQVERAMPFYNIGVIYPRHIGGAIACKSFGGLNSFSTVLSTVNCSILQQKR
jgi:biotin operon repressor